jgi:hypothetical protein
VSQLTAPSERRPPRRRRLLLTAAAVLAAVAAAVSVYCISAACWELAAAIAETDRLDPGWRFEDLEAQRQLPPVERNAALQVLKAQSLIPPRWSLPRADPQDEGPDVLADVLSGGSPEARLDEGLVLRLRASLEQAGPALEQARLLADMPEGRYPVAWAADVLSTSCPWSDILRSPRPLLQADALLRNQDGDPDGALVSARALVNMGRSLGDEPFFRAPLDRSVCRRDAARAVERTLAQGQPSERALAAVQESLAREDAVPLLLPHFRGERAQMHVFLTRVDEGKNRISELNCVPMRGLAAHAETWLGRPHALQIHARYLRGMNEAVEIAKLPLEQQYPLYREWRRQKGYVDKVGDGLTLAGWREDILFRDHALLRCAMVALAAERYRLEHGDWPRALADLVPGYLPAVPLDPIDGVPLRYRRTDGEAVIWSVGADGRDDGGDPNPPPGKGLPRDVVFTLWDVARRRQPPNPPAPQTAGGKKEAGKE